MHLGTGWEMCPNHMPASRLQGGGACRRRAFLFKPHERSVELLGNCEQPVGIEGARLHEPQGTQKVLVEGEASKLSSQSQRALQSYLLWSPQIFGSGK